MDEALHMSILEHRGGFFLVDLSELGVELADERRLRVAHEEADVHSSLRETGGLGGGAAGAFPDGDGFGVLQDEAPGLLVRNHLFGRLQGDVLFLAYELQRVLELEDLGVIGAGFAASRGFGDVLDDRFEHLLEIWTDLALRFFRGARGELKRVVHEVVEMLQIHVGVMKVALFVLRKEFE